jgi:hypothetical protein
MTGRIPLSRTVNRRVVVSGALGLVVAVAFLVISNSYPLPVMIGALPGRMAAALALGTALAVIAAWSPRASRKPTLSMEREDLVRIFAWWLLVAFALALAASAAWRVWGVVLLFAAIAATVKALSVFSYVKQNYEFRLWLPFAAILGIVVFMVAFGLFVARPNIPPPVAAALDAYPRAPVSGAPATRAAPDLTSIGFALDLSGDVDLGGLRTTFFSYHAANGARIDLYESAYGFPRPPGSGPLDETPGWWAKVGSLHVLGGAAQTEFLVVGPKKAIVIGVAQAMPESAGAQERPRAAFSRSRSFTIFFTSALGSGLRTVKRIVPFPEM